MSEQGRVVVFLCAGLLSCSLVFAQPVDPVEPNREQSRSQPVAKDALDRDGVRKVQAALNEAGYNAGAVDGIWGAQTNRALREFQQAKQLEPTAQLDDSTLLALGFALDEFDEARPPPVLAESDVRQVQEALNKAGYNVGAVDGIWGPATASALRNFQESKGLEATGRIDHDTVLALGLSVSEFAAGEFQEPDTAE